MTDLQGPERLTVADADRAREVAIGALDALNDQGDTETADYWVGYLELLVRTAFATGCRWGELIAVRGTDVDKRGTGHARGECVRCS